MKKLITLAAALWAAPVLAQTQATPAPTPAVQTSGSIVSGVQQVDNTTNSSKLTEYRDLQDSFYVPALTFGARHQRTGVFFDLSGANVSRADQTILASAGRPGAWNAQVSWIGVPHNYSNRAVTPYIRRGPGLFEVPATVPITFKKLGTGSADTPGVLASDELIAAYQRAFLTPTPLGTQTNTGHAGLTWSGSDAVSLGIAYDLRDKSGLKPTFGPIGDRPPRTLNIQLTEPVDYRTNDLTLSAEHHGGAHQVRAEYLFSDFANRIDTLQWENVYATPAAGATYDVWDRAVSAYGVRPLPPDNRYHHASVTFGGDLPGSSRVTATAAYGRMEQNETLVPYSYNSDQLAVKSLPRSTADALIDTLNFTADYVVSPAPGVNVRAFYRRYDLNNDTPSSQWQYVTSDTSNLNGNVSYANKRVNLPYAWDRQNMGAEATWRLPRRSTLTFGYEHEGIGREHREADTAEDIFRAAWRTRAAQWISFDARFVQGVRDGGVYENAVTKAGYWYSPSDANDNNNPALTFDNHPDMRRFDVSDRLRRQVDVKVNLTPRDIVAVSAYVRYRMDDFDSNVVASQPLLGSGLSDQAATTPGDQLGRLKDARTRYGIDAFVQPGPRVSLNAFLNFDKGTALERSIEFNENNKANPSAVAVAELGPWTRASSQWTADFDDRTWSAGLGAALQIVPERLAFNADYTLSLTRFDITYGGYGTANFDGTPFPATHQFAFSSPPTVREDLHVLNLRVEVPLKTVMLVAGYSYEKYSLLDWQQSPSAPWVESVGADTLLRDTSRSYQWGNRLFNLGTYLAPGYGAHIGFVGFRYRF
ncbi:MAG: hypothetical protein A3H96_21205 [Acidobacteria bacterium RIFCSPLOWO2_02_FULL_67_36]|nr:MAG: hypothetical protein A3H96_21205 [Acidobacteria bacterium RIFCSPLOWO2_02_FULL_67_36]